MSEPAEAYRPGPETCAAKRCGKTFDPGRSTQRYCSRKCGLREKSRLWRKTHPEKAREYSERHYKANPEKAYEASRRWQKANPEKKRKYALRYYRTHREKVREYSRRYQATHPEQSLHYLAAYGLTVAGYVTMLAAQNGACAICHQPEKTTHNGKGIRLSVDHDHETGRVRGLLCAKCNLGIGRLGESVERLRQAVDYLERHAATVARP
jgi:hypothetical protein